MIVPHLFANPNGKRVGETVTVDGKEFKVIGICSDIAGCNYIPLETYFDMGLTTESATVYAAEKADADSGAMTAKLKAVLGSNVTIGEPEMINKMDESSSQEGLKSLSITYAVVILVFLFLFLQMVAETGRETAICRTFGATGTKIALMHFCEVLLLTGASSLVGILLHAALYKPVFSKLNAKDVFYYPKDYLFVFAVIIGITLVVSIPYVVRCLFLSPKEATLTRRKVTEGEVGMKRMRLLWSYSQGIRLVAMILLVVSCYALFSTVNVVRNLKSAYDDYAFIRDTDLHSAYTFLEWNMPRNDREWEQMEKFYAENGVEKLLHTMEASPAVEAVGIRGMYRHPLYAMEYYDPDDPDSVPEEPQVTPEETFYNYEHGVYVYTVNPDFFPFSRI